MRERSKQNALHAAKEVWENWAKDKPHAEAARQQMAQIIQGDLALAQNGYPQINDTIKNGYIDLDAAYQAAICIHSGIN